MSALSPALRRLSVPWLALPTAAALLLAGCAGEPAFRAVQPAALELDGRSIAVIGDLQQTSAIARLVRRREDNAAAQQRLLADLGARSGDLGALVVVGDLVFAARSRRDWSHFDTLVAPFAAAMPVLPAIGNHDYPCYLVQFCRSSVIARGMRERFPWFEPGQPYAVSSGRLLLLFLDSETGLAGQGAWLSEQLELAAGRFAAALVFFHRPAFSYSVDRGARGDPDVQRYLVPPLEAAALPVVAVSGHIHGLEYIVRGGVQYVTTAGGGGPRGPMGPRGEFDRYAGPECPQPDSGEVFRPFNYLLLTASAARLQIAIRGFCKGDAAVSDLATIEIAL